MKVQTWNWFSGSQALRAEQLFTHERSCLSTLLRDYTLGTNSILEFLLILVTYDGIFQARVLEWGAIAFSDLLAQVLGKSWQLLYWQFSSVQLLIRVWLFATPWTAARQASLYITIPWACSSSCPSSRWYHSTISSSVVPFSSCLQSVPASGFFPMSPFFASGRQSIGASASVLPINIQGWFPLELTALISLQSKELSRVFSNTTVKN